MAQTADADESFERSLEMLAERTDEEPEDDYDIQQLNNFIRRPLNLNGPPEAIRAFPLLNAIQSEQLLRYREQFGNFVSKYELQAVPGMPPDLVSQLLPFITIESTVGDIVSLGRRWYGGKQSLAIRPSIIPEKQKGFIAGDSSGKSFLGSRPRYFFRYRYQYRNLLEYGITGDKDAGEKFGFNRRQKGFDFYSLHLFVRKAGLVRALALGDFVVNMGQGLIHWHSQSFAKNGSVINIKREGETIRPYHSAGEYNFHRGMGLSIGRERWELTAFASLRKISANLSFDDSLGTVISSVNTNGLYRTIAELERKNNVTLTTYGFCAKIINGASCLGVNSAIVHYSLPLLKRDALYNLYSIKGANWWNASVNYAYTFHDMHLFGEIAADRRGKSALLAGLIASLAAYADFALLYRSINKAYQSVFGNAFTENTSPTNEKGVYLGFSFKPSYHWKMDIYVDHFVFPWLRFRASAPGSGTELMMLVEWKPSRTTTLYSRFRYRTKPMDETMRNERVAVPVDHSLLNWRLHFAFQPHKSLLFRGRVEVSRYNYPAKDFPDRGFLLYEDLKYKALGKPYSASVRLEFFDCDSYDTRIYAYENDVLFAGSTPGFYGRGCRVYINMSFLPRKFFVKQFDCNLGLKVSLTRYKNRDSMGSGLDEIGGPRKSELRFQIFLSRK